MTLASAVSRAHFTKAAFRLVKPSGGSSKPNQFVYRATIRFVPGKRTTHDFTQKEEHENRWAGVRAAYLNMTVICEKHDPMVVAQREMRHCVSFPTAGKDSAPVVRGRGDTESADSVYKYLTSLVELTPNRCQSSGWMGTCQCASSGRPATPSAQNERNGNWVALCMAHSAAVGARGSRRGFAVRASFSSSLSLSHSLAGSGMQGLCIYSCLCAMQPLPTSVIFRPLLIFSISPPCALNVLDDQ